jgi:hypothetical protein
MQQLSVEDAPEQKNPGCEAEVKRGWRRDAVRLVGLQGCCWHKLVFQ